MTTYLLRKTRTLLAERLAARAGTKILLLDIVASVTVRIVVVDILLDRMPRIHFSHLFCSPLLRG